MPFPLAHPAAVLPFRRYCPRYFSFPALIIGSVVPDLGYGLGRPGMAVFSHRFVAGAFGFCLPVGLVILLLFYLARRRVVAILPARHRLALTPLCERPAGPVLVMVVSLLVGAWTHLLLDSLTHRDGWLTLHLPVLQTTLPLGGKAQVMLCDVLYAVCTFCGVAWLAVAYLGWLKRATGPASQNTASAPWLTASFLASLVLALAMIGRGPRPQIGLPAVGVISLLLVSAFFLATSRSVCKTD